jgi:crotonobetainyl-CoA:carnitine CoA-transferase CaiB-like acyl-CoA transferase
VPASPVNPLDRTMEHPLTLEREPYLRAAGDEADEARRLVRLPFEAAGTEVRWPPALGAHTREVLEAAGVAAELVETVLADARRAGAPEGP